MVPLLAAMDHPVSADQVSVGILDSNEINAANAGSGRFFVTKGLLARANDNNLRAILAHEISRRLNHVAKAQVLGAGLGIGGDPRPDLPGERSDHTARGRARRAQVQPRRGVRRGPAGRRAAAALRT
jgi:hypothetical protein